MVFKRRRQAGKTLQLSTAKPRKAASQNCRVEERPTAAGAFSLTNPSLCRRQREGPELLEEPVITGHPRVLP